MSCGNCGKSSIIDNWIINIDGKEYISDNRIISKFLTSILKTGQLSEGEIYNFSMEHKTTGSILKGELEFIKGYPFLNGRRMF